MTTKEASVTIALNSPTPIVQRSLDEQLDVVGDALVRVVGGIALQLHAIMVGVLQPFAEIVTGHPAAPADLKPLVEIKLIDREHDHRRGQHAKTIRSP